MSKRADTPTPEELDLRRRRRRPLLTRRGFLKLLGGAAATAAGGGAYAWRVEPHWIQVVRRDLPIAHLPDSLAGRSLALVADLHVGRVVDGDYIRGAMDRVNALAPDLIAIVGDFMTCRADEQIDNAVEVVSRLNAPPLGIFAVPGNHDYGRGWRSPAVADALIARLRGDLGVRVLRNELAWVEKLQVVGLDDLWARRPGAGGSGEPARPRARPQDMEVTAGAEDGPARGGDVRPGDGGPQSRNVAIGGPGPARGGRFFDPEAVMPTVDPGSAAVVLLHNPDAADRGDWAGYRGWVLCGHTHGGQVDLPLIGPPIVPVRNERYVSGEVDVGEGRRLYINRGLGYLRRVRLFCRPEITLFTLQRAPDEKRASSPESSAAR